MKCFWLRTNHSKMFFFRGYITVKVSPTLKNRPFFMVMPFWTLWEGKKDSKSASTKFASGAVKIENRIKNSKKIRILLRNL